MSEHPTLALVTGASRGIGAYLAQQLFREADIIILCARSREGLLQTASKIEQLGGTPHCIVGDLCDSEHRKEIIRKVSEMGTLRIIIHNAGVEYAMAFREQSTTQIKAQLELNVHAPILLTHGFLPLLLEQDYGRIVFISSMSGKSPTPYNSIYSASKFAINGFVGSTTLELKGTGVHMGVVCPSFVAEVGMWADTGVKAPAMMREVSLKKVLKGVRQILDARSHEALVTPTPVRPLLALYALFPSLGGGY